MLNQVYPIHYRTLTVTNTVTNTAVITTTRTVTMLTEVTVTHTPATNLLNIVQLSFYRVDKPDNRFNLDFEFSVKNIGNRSVRLKLICIPNATKVIEIDVVLNPGDTYTAGLSVFNNQPYVENGVDWSRVWRKNTEHVIILLYYVIGDPNPYVIVGKGLVE